MHFTDSKVKLNANIKKKNKQEKKEKRSGECKWCYGAWILIAIYFLCLATSVRVSDSHWNKKEHTHKKSSTKRMGVSQEQVKDLQLKLLRFHCAYSLVSRKIFHLVLEILNTCLWLLHMKTSMELWILMHTHSPFTSN